MTPATFEGADKVFRLDDADGGGGHLPVKMVGGVSWSIWTPNAEELAALNSGAGVMLGVAIGRGKHPAVSIAVQDPPAADA